MTPSWNPLAPSFTAVGLLVAGFSHAMPAGAAVVSAEADFDRWSYPFNATPGVRASASTFGAFGSAAFDERDGQVLLGFDAAKLLPALAPGESYRIDAVSVTATHTSGGFAYDPTYDAFASHLDAGDPRFIADADAGRPIVLTGVGLRNGYASLGFGDNAGAPVSPPTFEEDEAFGPSPTPAAGTRSVFAAAFDGSGNLIDVSNNVGSNGVSGGFDFTPFAVGVTGLAPGAMVSEGTPGVSAGSTFTFDLDLADSDTRGYVEAGVAGGGLFFALSSLHTTGIAGGSNPNFGTADGFDPAGLAPGVSIAFAVVPEPASLAFLGAGGLLLLRRVRPPAA